MAFAPDKSGQAAQPIALAGGLWLLTGTLTLSGSYATGGDTVDLTVHFPAGKTIRSCVGLGSLRGFGYEYDTTNKKILLYGQDPAAASIQVSSVQHGAAAYDSDLAVAHPVAFLLKG
jgi:hypothetical protein